MSEQFTTTAKVIVTLEIPARSNWGEKCGIDQIYKQAEDEVRGYLAKNFSTFDRKIKIIGDVEVKAIITSSAKP